MRCGASNRCRYCSWLAALENSVALYLDAAIRLPEIGFTLTTVAPRTDPVKFRRDVAGVFKIVRRRWPHAQYCGMVEFTTGLGSRSGGHRRIHQHGLLKGVPGQAADLVGDVLRREWSARTGAHRVEAHELHRPAGAIAYLVNHHQKTAQTPPSGWSGKRLRPSKGYYERPASELREEARMVLSEKRLAHAVEAALLSEFEDGSWSALNVMEDPLAFEELLQERRERPAPTLVRVANLPTAFSEAGDPVAWEPTELEAVHAP